MREAVSARQALVHVDLVADAEGAEIAELGCAGKGEDAHELDVVVLEGGDVGSGLVSAPAAGLLVLVEVDALLDVFDHQLAEKACLRGVAQGAGHRHVEIADVDGVEEASGEAQFVVKLPPNG